MSLHEQIHKEQKTTPSDIPSEPPNKQSAEMVQPPRLRPQRVAARRQKELLCAFQFQELQWMELDDVDTEGLVLLPVSSIKSGIENSEAFWSEETLYFNSMTLFCIVILVSLCCSFKKIYMFSFQ